MVDVSWIAIVAAAACGFVVGGIWYGPIMGKKWLGATGLTEADIQGANMPLIYGGAFAFSLLSSFMLAIVYASYLVNLDLMQKVMMSSFVAFGFIIPAIGTNYLFSQKSKSLFFIDAGYWLLFYIAMGVVHGLLG
ncbi:MAG: DUF1761 domain-containing protein [Pseudomonadota bacterium]